MYSRVKPTEQSELSEANRAERARRSQCARGDLKTLLATDHSRAPEVKQIILLFMVETKKTPKILDVKKALMVNQRLYMR